MATKLPVARFQGPCKHELIRSASTNLTLKVRVNMQLRRNSWVTVRGKETFPILHTISTTVKSSDTKRDPTSISASNKRIILLCSLVLDIPVGVPHHLACCAKTPFTPFKFLLKSHGGRTDPFFLELCIIWVPQKLNTNYAWSCDIRKVRTFHPCMPGTRSFTRLFRTGQLNGHKPPSLL